MKMIIKKVGCDPQLIETDKKYRCDTKDMIGADILETVKITDDGLFQMWVDEDGLPRQRDLNFLMAMNNPMYPIQMIVGDVMFVRIKKPDYSKELWDYEIDDIRAEDMKKMYELLGKQYQYELYLKYKKGMGGIL